MNQLPKLLNGLRPSRDQVSPEECLCDYCTAKCCQYFALPIDTPTEQEDLDHIRWYLMHEHAAVFVEDDQWYLLIQTRCKNLRPDFRCGIYETRPQICRDYKTDKCEYDDDAVYDMYFETSEQVAEYMEAMRVDKDKEVVRSALPPLLPILN